MATCSIVSTSPPPRHNSTYLEKVAGLVKQTGTPWPVQRTVTDEKSRLFYTGLPEQETWRTLTDLIPTIDTHSQAKVAEVLVIQNITPDLIETLAGVYTIDPAFLAGHAERPLRDRIIDTHWEHVWDWQHPEPIGPRKFYNIWGVFTCARQARRREDEVCGPNYFRRDSWVHNKDVKQMSTCISYIRISEFLYLILVDANPGIEGSQWTESMVTLRMLYGSDHGDILLPSISFYPADIEFKAGASYDLFHSMQSFLSHRWHFSILFSQPSEYASPVQPFLYLLSSSLWQSNIRQLDRKIKLVSYVELPSPSFETSNRLHILRRLLARLVSGIGRTNTYMPASLGEFYDKVPKVANRHPSAPLLPMENCRRILKDAEKLDTLLMNTFQLLMSSLSIKDSQKSIEQSRRGTSLTVLAFVYVPMSFVTGIFGMNIKEINGTGMNIWVCVVTVAALFVATGPGCLFYWVGRYRREAIAVFMRKSWRSCVAFGIHTRGVWFGYVAIGRYKIWRFYAESASRKERKMEKAAGGTAIESDVT